MLSETPLPPLWPEFNLFTFIVTLHFSFYLLIMSFGSVYKRKTVSMLPQLSTLLFTCPLIVQRKNNLSQGDPQWETGKIES